MKKKNLLFLALAFSALTLSSCGSSTPDGGDPGRPDSSEIALDFMTFIWENNISFDNQTLAYTGAPQTIEISGTLPQGYRVYYTGGDKVDVGTYPVQARFKGPGLPDSENDFLEALMTIVPGAVDESKIVFEDATYVFDDEYHSLEVARPYPEGIVDVTYSNANFYDVGTYEVTAYFEVDRNHAPVDPKTATLTILPYEVDMSGVVFEDKTVTFDGNFHSIYADNLPEGVEVEYENNYKKDAGVYTVTANFIAPLNAAPIDPMTATLTIDKAPFDVSSLSFPDQQARYDGQTHPIALEGTLPNGLKVIYENNENVELGEHEVTAHFAWDDSYQYVQNLKNNYLLPADMKATLTIIKGIPVIEFKDLSVPYDEQAHSITIEGDLPEGITVEYTNNGQTKAGEYEITAHFSGVNDHYECPEDMKATLYIEDDYEGLVYEQVDDHYAVVDVVPEEGDTVLNIPAVYEGLPVKEVNLSCWSDSPFEKLFVHGDLDSFSMQGIFPKLQSAHFYGDVTAFESLYYCHALTEILFDGDVKAIGTNAFTEAGALETIALPDALEAIGDRAFNFCQSLKTIHFPSGLTSIGEYAFRSCELEEVVLPGSLTSLGRNAFEDCASLASVSYGSKITSIADGTFQSCTALKRINSSTDGVFDLGEHVTSLGARALYENELVTTILAPNLAGVIDEYSFENLPNLSRVEVGDAITAISFGLSHVPNLESFNSLVPGEIVLPASTERVSTSFNDCEKIKSVVFNAALRSVYASFRDSPQVAEVILPASVVTFDSFNASSLVHFVAPGIDFNNSALSFQASGLRSLTAPAWVLRDLPREARASLEEVTIVGSDSVIVGYLSECTNLKTLRLETNLRSPETLNIPSLTSLSLGPQVTDPIYLHQLPALKTLTVDADNPSYSTDGVLLYNKDKTAILGAVASSEIAATYADYALPSTITSIGKYGMSGAKWLHSFSSDHAFSIAERALASCPNLTTVVFPNDLTRVGPSSYEDPYPLASCPVTHLTTPCINDANTVAATLENLTITDVKGASPTYPDAFPNLTEIYFVGNGVKEAAPLLERAHNLAKFRATGLEELIDGSYIPYVMDEQGGLYVYRMATNNYAGYELLGVSPDLCPSVFEAPRTKEIALVIIGQEAFRGCTSLTEYSSSGMRYAQTEIKKDAFLGCTSLTQIHIDGGEDTIIRTGAFDHVFSLKTFTTNPDPSYYGGVVVEENAFLSCTLTLFQGMGTKDGRISSYAFNDCAYLKYVNIQGADFRSHAFHDCPAITDVELYKIGAFAADAFDEPESITAMNGLSYSGVLSEPKLVGANLTSLTTVKSKGLLDYYLAGFTSVRTYTMEAQPSGKSTYEDVGAYACAGCTNLRNVFLLEGIRTIEERAFQNCVSLGSLALPASVRTLGEGVFEGCTSLQTLYYDGTMERWESMTKGENWKGDAKFTKVCCSDGEITL